LLVLVYERCVNLVGWQRMCAGLLLNRKYLINGISGRRNHCRSQRAAAQKEQLLNGKCNVVYLGSQRRSTGEDTSAEKESWTPTLIGVSRRFSSCNPGQMIPCIPNAHALCEHAGSANPVGPEERWGSMVCESGVKLTLSLAPGPGDRGEV